MGILGNLVVLETLFAACIMQLLRHAGYTPHTKAVSLDSHWSICLLAFKAVLGECGIGLPNNAAPLCPLPLLAMYVMDEPGPDAYDSAM